MREILSLFDSGGLAQELESARNSRRKIRLVLWGFTGALVGGALAVSAIQSESSAEPISLPSLTTTPQVPASQVLLEGLPSEQALDELTIFEDQDGEDPAIIEGVLAFMQKSNDQSIGAAGSFLQEMQAANLLSVVPLDKKGQLPHVTVASAKDQLSSYFEIVVPYDFLEKLVKGEVSQADLAVHLLTQLVVWQEAAASGDKAGFLDHRAQIEEAAWKLVIANTHGVLGDRVQSPELQARYEAWKKANLH